MELNKKLFYSLLIAQIIITTSAYFFVRLDDAYIFYTYAKNLSNGNGYVFNLNEKINATTSFAYTILISLISIPIKSISYEVYPIIGLLLSIISLAIISVLLIKLFLAELKEAKFLLPIILFSMPQIKYSIGMESAIKLLFLVWSLYLFNHKKFISLGLVSGILVLFRPDTIIFLFILMIFYCVENKKFPPFSSSIIFLIVILSYSIFSLIYFKSLIPTSLRVKTIQRENNLIEGDFLSGFINTFPGGEKLGIVFYFLIALALIVLIVTKSSIFRNKNFQILLFYFIAYTFVYGLILNPPPYPWYYFDFIILFTLIVYSFINLILEKIQTQIRSYFISFITFTIFSIGLVQSIHTLKNGFNEKFILYKNISNFLNTVVQNGKSLAADEIGIFGFYFNGKIIDELGLITPEAIENIKKKDFSLTIKNTMPDFVIVDYPKFPHYKSYILSDWFRSNYELFYMLKSFNSGIQVFKRTNSLLPSKHPTNRN
ncbi:MAG: hypothetical protein N3F03_02165 [Ignavibacteria bacterium]|nr:hypothetical protein [Ignavibacteria bacterium]